MSDPRDPRDPRYPPRRPGLYEQHPIQTGMGAPVTPLIPMPVQLPGMTPPSPFTPEGRPSGYVMQVPEGQPFPRKEMFEENWFRKLAGAVSHGVEAGINRAMEKAVESGLTKTIPGILDRFIKPNPKLDMGFFFEFPSAPFVTYFHKVGVIAYGNAGANAIQNITLTNDGTAQLSVARGQVLFLTDIRFSIVVSGLGLGPVILSSFGQQSDYSLLGSTTFRVAIGGRGFMNASVEVPAALSATTFQDGVGVIQRGFGTQSGVKYVIYCEEGAQIDSQVISRTAIAGIPGGAIPYAICELFGFSADKVWSKRYNSWI